jgi:hypothetical protein
VKSRVHLISSGAAYREHENGRRGKQLSRGTKKKGISRSSRQRTIPSPLVDELIEATIRHHKKWPRLLSHYECWAAAAKVARSNLARYGLLLTLIRKSKRTRADFLTRVQAGITKSPDTIAVDPAITLRATGTSCSATPTPLPPPKTGPNLKQRGKICNGSNIRFKSKDKRNRNHEAQAKIQRTAANTPRPTLAAATPPSPPPSPPSATNLAAVASHLEAAMRNSWKSNKRRRRKHRPAGN